MKKLNGSALKLKRVTAGISGHVLSKKLRISRSWLSLIERGAVEASQEELERISIALDELIAAQSELSEMARSMGLNISLTPLV